MQYYPTIIINIHMESLPNEIIEIILKMSMNDIDTRQFIDLQLICDFWNKSIRKMNILCYVNNEKNIMFTTSNIHPMCFYKINMDKKKIVFYDKIQMTEVGTSVVEFGTIYNCVFTRQKFDLSKDGYRRWCFASDGQLFDAFGPYRNARKINFLKKWCERYESLKGNILIIRDINRVLMENAIDTFS